MCLSSVTTVHKKPVMRTFYKVFSVKRKKLFNLSYETGAVHFIGEKRTEAVKIKIGYGKVTYTSGVHGFATKIGAEAWKNLKHMWSSPKRRVFKCRGLVRTEGYQWNMDKIRRYMVFVADTMEIISEVKP